MHNVYIENGTSDEHRAQEKNCIPIASEDNVQDKHGILQEHTDQEEHDDREIYGFSVDDSNQEHDVLMVCYIT